MHKICLIIFGGVGIFNMGGVDIAGCFMLFVTMDELS